MVNDAEIFDKELEEYLAQATKKDKSYWMRWWWK